MLIAILLLNVSELVQIKHHVCQVSESGHCRFVLAGAVGRLVLALLLQKRDIAV
jgi:hypothetical protein